MDVIKFNGSNYPEWSDGIKDILLSKGLWEVTKDEKAPDDKSWKENNGKALGLIRSSIPAHFKHAISDLDTAKEALAKMKSEHELTSEEEKIELYRHMFDKAEIQQGEKVAIFISRLQGIQDQLKGGDASISEYEIVLKVLG